MRDRERKYRKGSREQGRSLMNLHNNEAGRRVSIQCGNMILPAGLILKKKIGHALIYYKGSFQRGVRIRGCSFH